MLNTILLVLILISTLYIASRLTERENIRKILQKKIDEEREQIGDQIEFEILKKRAEEVGISSPILGSFDPKKKKK